MSNRIPSRKEILRRAHKFAERIKDQWFDAEDVYDDARDVMGAKGDGTVGEGAVCKEGGVAEPAL